MVTSERQTVELHDGTELNVQHLAASGDDTAEFEVEVADDADGRRWLVEISRFGGVNVVEAWDDGVQAELDRPNWLHELADRAV